MPRQNRFSAVLLGALLFVFIAAIGAPASISAKELASEAIAVAVENGTFDQLRQDLLMDLHQQTRFEFDEEGIERVGRALLDEGKNDEAMEVLQFNQMINIDSAPATVALADAYRDSGSTAAARTMYQRALRIEPGNQHAQKELLKIETRGGASKSPGLRQAGIDPDALAAMGATPEQIHQMEEAIAQAQETPVGYGGSPRSTRGAPVAETTRPVSPNSSEPVYESEFCEVLHRYNAEKRITDARIRARVAGQYGKADDGKHLRTWNIDTNCGEFLLAAPMWADVSPPVLSHKGGDVFEDSRGAIWEFQFDADDAVTGVTVVAADGSVSELKHWGDPHENLNGKHIKDWQGSGSKQ